MNETLSITDVYMTILASLSNNDKLELISKLSSSMRNESAMKRVRPNLRTCFVGDWSDVNAADLRNADYHIPHCAYMEQPRQSWRGVD